MIHLLQARDALAGFIALGGPVVALILCLSVLAGAVILFKLGQFHTTGVGRHAGLTAAVRRIEAGSDLRPQDLPLLHASHLGPLLADALHAAHSDGQAARSRLYAQAEAQMARLESGFRLLDVVAQTAPLLGLFGTVLGMIDAFRAMQGAGAQVDPSVLAGGIWVALMTTAAGLAVAMPASAILSWFEARMAAERRLATLMIETALCPGGGAVALALDRRPGARVAHA